MLSQSAISTALRFWQDAKEENTPESWHEFFLQMDALAHYLMHRTANALDREYFLEMRTTAIDMMVEAK